MGRYRRRMGFGAMRVVLASALAVAALAGGPAATVAGAATPPLVVRSSVVDADGSPASGVSVDLFVSIGGLDRGSWVKDGQTGSDGTVAFADLAPDCYQLTFIAPAGKLFTQNFQPFLTPEGVCIGEGFEEAVVPAAQLIDRAAVGTISGTVLPAPGVTNDQAGPLYVGVFAANGDGSRGAWTRDAAIPVGGPYSVDVLPGCYVLTFVPPAAPSFDSTRIPAVFFGDPATDRLTEYESSGAVCVKAGETVSGVSPTARLYPIDRLARVVAGLSNGGSNGVNSPNFVLSADELAKAGVALGVFRVNGDGSRGAWVRDIPWGQNAQIDNYLFPGCYIFTYVAPPGMAFLGSRTYLSTQAGCTDAGQTVISRTPAWFVSDTRIISGTVRNADGTPVPGVSVGLFSTFLEPEFSGSNDLRGGWLADVVTGPDGRYRFTSLMPLGSYIVIAVAPAGRQFTVGGPYFRTFVDVFDRPETTVDATLS